VDYATAKFWIDLAQTFFTGALGVYIYMVNRERVTNRRIKELEDTLEERLNDHASRLAKVETTCCTTPSQTQLHTELGKVYERMNRIDTTLNDLAGESRANRQLLTTMHTFLLERNA
jgi:hypothetical protein